MFTGIIEVLGTVSSITTEGSNKHLKLNSPIAAELKVDQSLAHNGVCLTVVNINGSEHTVTAIAETIIKTNLGSLQIGESVNLERCLKADGRLDGHIVQGHIDCTGIITDIQDLDGSWKFKIRHPESPDYLTIPRGSVTVNGVSLTVADSMRDGFTVAVIPYTFANTVFHLLQAGSAVNLEFDILGKYAAQLMQSAPGLQSIRS